MWLNAAVEGVGKRALAFARYAGGIAYLTGDTLVSLLSPRHQTRWREITHQMVRFGVSSLPIVSLVLLFIGMILGIQMAYVLSFVGAGAEVFVPRVISVSIIRELGPLITAILMSGRVGAAIAAEIGTMAVNEEIVALQTSALSPVRFLVVPRVVAAFFMFPALTVYANFVGILGGALVCGSLLDMNLEVFRHEALYALVQRDLVTGIIKSFAFALVVTLVACYEGLRVERGAEGVGRATTSAVVLSIVLIIATDALFTWLFFYVFQA